MPAALEDYKALLATVKRGFEEKSTVDWRSKLIRQLIHKIEIGTDRVIIHYRIGQKWVKTGMESKKWPSNPEIFKGSGSRTLQSGGSGWI